MVESWSLMKSLGTCTPLNKTSLGQWITATQSPVACEILAWLDIEQLPPLGHRMRIQGTETFFGCTGLPAGKKKCPSCNMHDDHMWVCMDMHGSAWRCMGMHGQIKGHAWMKQKKAQRHAATVCMQQLHAVSDKFFSTHASNFQWTAGTCLHMSLLVPLTTMHAFCPHPWNSPPRNAVSSEEVRGRQQELS